MSETSIVAGIGKSKCCRKKCAPGPCASGCGCGACRRTYSLTAAGISGAANCTGFNGSFTVHKCCQIADCCDFLCESCQWSVNADACNEASATWNMGCRGPRISGCTFGPADGYWRIWNTECTVVFRSATKGGCPPTGAWTLEYNGCTASPAPTLSVAAGAAEGECPPTPLCPTDDCDSCFDIASVELFPGYAAPCDDLAVGVDTLTRSGCVWTGDLWKLVCESGIWYVKDVATNGARATWRQPTPYFGGCFEIGFYVWVSGTCDPTGQSVAVS